MLAGISFPSTSSGTTCCSPPSALLSIFDYRIMLKTVAISLSLLFIADAVGITLFMVVYWMEIRHEMKTLFRSEGAKDKAVILYLDHDEYAQLNWIEKDHEFYHNGKLYDVVSELKGVEQIQIKCFEDHREANYYQHIQKAIERNLPISKNSQGVVLAIFKFLSGLISTSLTSTPIDYSVSQSTFPAYILGYHSPDPNHLFQPPDFI